MATTSLIMIDGPYRDHLLPFTFTRPTADIRFGIMTFREKWEKYLNLTSSTITQEYLSKKYTVQIEDSNLLIHGIVAPDRDLVKSIQQLEINEALYKGDLFLGAQVTASTAEMISQHGMETLPENIKIKKYDQDVLSVKYPWEIFQKNHLAIDLDFHFLTEGRSSAQLSSTNTLIAPENIFVEEGVTMEACTINASGGPVYLGHHVEIMEGSTIRGPLAMCDHTTLKLSTKIYGATTIGPHSKVGGEVNNSVIFGYSNKAHDGFLGNSVIGEWCNLGADTNNSNLKNNYSNVEIWSYAEKKYVDTGAQFAGLFMGDHSKCAINTMFNTGTVVGVSANIYGAGFPRKHIPSFAWGGEGRFMTYQLKKVMEVAEKVMSRRSIELSETEIAILESIFENTATDRKWEKKIENA